MRRFGSIVTGISTAVAVTAGLMVAPGAAASASVRSINWAPCYQWLSRDGASQGIQVRYECAQVPVPLDYDKPGGAAVLVSVVRIPASDADRRVGSLFFNPGGPGGSGVDFVLGAGPFVYSDEVRARFDIVGFDPRGVARSTQLRCVGSVRQTSPWFTDLPWPETPAELDTWATSDAAVQGDCDQRGGRILDHMSTADVARDLDRLRAAVGDPQLSYVGYSYGSYLGATYANLFPGRVRAVVVDGVLDPVAWSTGDPVERDWPFSTRLRSHVGAQDTLEEFFRLCDQAGSDCPFASPEGAEARYLALRQTLAIAPVVFDDGFAYTDRILVADTLGNLYGSAGWWYFADWLATLEALAAAPGRAPAQAYQSQRRSVGSGRGGFPHYPGLEAFGGVACADSDNPNNLTHWTAAADDTRTDSLFGPLWTWASSICSAWPGSQDDRYTGPWTAATAKPVLVVNTQFDPATPLHGADRLAELLPNSAQLTVEGWGHTAAFLSTDADHAVSAYLLDGTLPTPGASYAQDFNPFTPPEGATAGDGLRAQFEQILFDPAR